MNKAIFLDRDGVLIKEDGEYTYTIDKLEVNQGVVEALKKWKDAGYLLIVISNQGGVSRGMYSREDVFTLHAEIERRLNEGGASIDAYYFCPHHDQFEKCLCRKPLPLMLEKAMARFDIDPRSSYFIGDSERDWEAGKAARLNVVELKINGNLAELKIEG